jgi:hypothetical protein
MLHIGAIKLSPDCVLLLARKTGRYRSCCLALPNPLWCKSYVSSTQNAFVMKNYICYPFRSGSARTFDRIGCFGNRASLSHSSVVMSEQRGNKVRRHL